MELQFSSCDVGYENFPLSVLIYQRIEWERGFEFSCAGTIFSVLKSFLCLRSLNRIFPFLLNNYRLSLNIKCDAETKYKMEYSDWNYGE